MFGAERGDQHAPQDAAVARAERQRGFDQVAPHAGDRHRDHQHDLEHRADEDDQQLLQFANPRPQDQQRNEGGGRKVSREGDERLEERFDRLVGAHQDAERNGDQRGECEPAEDAPDRDRDVLVEAMLREEQPAVIYHCERIGEERLRHIAAQRRVRPGGEEDDKEQNAERDAERG